MATSNTATKAIEAARTFRPRILAERDRIEAGRCLPEELARDLARAGFFRIFLPAAYGGLDLTPLEAIDVYEELAGADASVAWCVWNANVHWTTARLPKEVGLEIFSDPTMILAGRWSLVSGCQLSAWLILMCTVYEGDKPRLTSSRAPEYRFMLCPVSDCEILDTWTVSGLRGTGSHDVIVEECFVPARYGSFYTDPLVLTGARYEIPAHSRVAPGARRDRAGHCPERNRGTDRPSGRKAPRAD
jgi:alkylation response protein AidB-like acyl-CoA dehydrogenase